MFHTDFECSVVEVGHHLRSLPTNHSLFIPEELVEPEHPGVQGMT